VEKLINKLYTIVMSLKDHLIPGSEKHSGEDIHKVIDDVHMDYEDCRTKRRNVELTIYYRDLLSFLIKNYGH